MDPGANGLMALSAYGQGSRRLYDNPTFSIYNSSYSKKTHSQFTYATIPFIAKPLLSQLDKSVFSVDLSNDNTIYGDLLGECYIDFTCTSIEHLYTTIASCSFCIDTHVLETFTGKTLEIMAYVFKQNKIVHETLANKRIHVMIPLPFFFTRSTSHYIPIANNLSRTLSKSLHIDMFLCENKLDIRDMSLVCKLVCLDETERNFLKRNMFSYMNYSMLSCVTFTQSQVLKQHVHAHAHAISCITLPTITSVRDIFIKTSRAISTINVVFNGHLHMSLNKLMATRILPGQLYGLSESFVDQTIYIIPFCQEPTANTFTSSIDLTKIDHAQLVLKFDELIEQDVDITIVLRHWDTLSFDTYKWTSDVSLLKK